MRTLLSALLIVICITTLLSCKKEESANTAPPSLVGTWELRKVTGQYNATYPTGNGYTIIFTAANFDFYDQGVSGYNGYYSIEKDNTNADPRYYFLYMNTQSPVDKKFLIVDGNRIIYWDDAADAPAFTYERIQ